MKTLRIVSGLLAATLLAPAASAALKGIYAPIPLAEDLVMGGVANVATTNFGEMSYDWCTHSAPISLAANESVTWGYNDGDTGNHMGQCPGSAFDMKNLSVRQVIRGANNNGGTARGMDATVKTSGQLVVTIWGPSLNNFGVTGATNFTWVISRGGVTYATGSGETAMTVPFSGLNVEVSITPSNANELGSTMIHFDI